MKVQIYNQKFNDGLGNKTIAKNLGISKNTVRKYVKVFEENLQCFKTLAPEEYDEKLVDLFKKDKMDVSSRKSKLITKDVSNFVLKCLEENKKKISSGKRKQIMKNIDIYEMLVEKVAFKGSRSTVNNYISKISDKHKEAFIKRSFGAGEVCEFDWGNVTLDIDGEEIKLKLAVFYLPFSKYRVSYLYEQENMEAFVDSHIKFIKDIGHIPTTFVYDNMRVAVAKFVGKKEKIPTQTLTEMSAFYGFDFRFCNTYKGNEKGGVEKSVEFVRRKAFSYSNCFSTITEAHEALAKKLESINFENLEKFKEDITPMKVKNYDFVYGEIKCCHVDKYSTIVIKHHHYSVPDYLVGKTVKVKATIDYIHVYYNDLKIAVHNRLVGKSKWTIDIMHYTNLFISKPGGIKDSLAFKSMCGKYKNLYTDYFEGAELEFIKTLHLILEYDFEEVHSTILKVKKYSSKITADIINLSLDSEKKKYVSKNLDDNDVLKAVKSSINKYAVLGG